MFADSSTVVIAQVQSTIKPTGVICDLYARLRSFSMIITQEPAQPFTTLHKPTSTNFLITRKQQNVVLALMIGR